MSEATPLTRLIEAKLEAGDVELPVFDDIAIRIHREAREGRLDADGICGILEQDATLVSEVLRMANSAFFSGMGEVRNLRDATVRLGVRQLASIVMAVSQRRLYSASPGPLRDRLTVLSRHAQAASMAARWIANRAGLRSLADEAHVAALLHDVGKLSLLRIMEKLGREGSVRLTHQMVDMSLSRLHCRHGARLLELWNLPEVYRDVVLHLEDEIVPEGALTLAIVRLADRTCALEGASDLPDPDIALEALPETAMLGLCEIDLAELRIQIEDMADGADVPGTAQAA